jgi:hypothetical protein
MTPHIAISARSLTVERCCWWDDRDMADSPTLRVQRHRRHSAGDHRLCVPSRCPAARVAVVVPVTGDGADLDPVGELRALAAGLMAAWRADPGNAILAREARATLLCVPPEPPDDPLAELRAMVEAVP